MPEGFDPVPEWTSELNEGGSVAVVERGPTTDALILRVDAGPQANQGWYRLARDLGVDGTVAGGWTPWIAVPDWFSWQNAGADVAVVDFGPGPDVVVLMVDAPEAANRGLYRIGHELQADGALTDWTPWIEVPDWFSWENSGAGIAVTPADAAGRRDLVVFMIDDGPEVNRGVYRVGHDLQRDGTVTDWSGWVDVPGWFSWANSGGGVAVADLDGSGGRDLIVFQIDDAVPTAEAGGRNEGFFRIGRGLAPDGTVTAWGPDWLGVPYWFPWQNEGGGVDVVVSGGRRQLAVLMVDAPDGPNAGYLQLVDLTEDPATHGRWEVKSFFSEVLAVHTGLLPGGDVLFFAGSGSSNVRFASPGLRRRRPGRADQRGLDPARRHLRPPGDPAHPRRPALRPVLRRRRVPGRRAAAVGRRHPGVQPVPGPTRRRRLRPGEPDLVLRGPDAARPLVPDPGHPGGRSRAGHDRAGRRGRQRVQGHAWRSTPRPPTPGSSTPSSRGSPGCRCTPTCSCSLTGGSSSPVAGWTTT